MSALNMEAAPMSGTSLDHLALDIVLPWHEHQEQQEKFKRLIKKVVIPCMAFLMVMQVLPDFSQEDEVVKKVVTKVILDPPKIQPVAQPDTSKPKEQKTQNRKKDAVSKAGTDMGLSSMASLSKQLSAMRNSAKASRKQKKNVFTSNNGKVKKSSRALLGQASANRVSGGLKASDITVNAKGTALADHKSGDIESPIMAIELPTAAQYNYDPTKNGKRDMQSIRRTLERYKGAVYALYSKALRINPDLSGRFVFDFVIEPSGAVSHLKIKSSELNDAKLEQKMLNKIKSINFGKEDLMATAVQYTFTFFPS